MKPKKEENMDDYSLWESVLKADIVFNFDDGEDYIVPLENTLTIPNTLKDDCECKVPSLKMLCFQKIKELEDEHQANQELKPKSTFFNKVDNTKEHENFINILKQCNVPEDLHQEFVLFSSKEIPHIQDLYKQEDVYVVLNFFKNISETKWYERPKKYWTQKAKWEMLWLWVAPMTISKYRPHQSIFLTLIYGSLMNELPDTLSENQCNLIHFFAEKWKYYTMRHLNGTFHDFLLLTKNEHKMYPLTPSIMIPKFNSLSSKIKQCIENDEHCTFNITKNTLYFLQPQWICISCKLGLENDFFVCTHCALKCHKNHQLLYRGIWNGFCDCFQYECCSKN